MTVFKEAGQLLRIFIGEANKYDRMPLYEWIVQQARSQGMAGATVLRGIQGFGANSLIHTTKILRLSEDLPVVVEIIDTKEKIESFLQTIDHAITEGIVTVEKAQVRMYRAGGKKTAEGWKVCVIEMRHRLPHDRSWNGRSASPASCETQTR